MRSLFLKYKRKFIHSFVTNVLTGHNAYLHGDQLSILVLPLFYCPANVSCPLAEMSVHRVAGSGRLRPKE